MDLGYLKVKIDIKSEHDELRKKYDYKRKEIKKEEIKKAFESFKDFFRADSNFKFKEKDQALIAEYKDHGISIEMDIYKNIDSESYEMEGCIKTFEKETFIFHIKPFCNIELHEQEFKNHEEKLIREINFFKDFLDDKIQYEFKYGISGRDETYNNMQQLMAAL